MVGATNDEPIHPKMRNKLIPEVTGQKIVNTSHVPNQFNNNKEVHSPFEHAPIQVMKPAHIFTNKPQPLSYSKHFIYDYLFVQISEQQYHREIGCRLKL